MTTSMFIICAGIAFLGSILLGLLFRPPPAKSPAEEKPSPPVRWSVFRIHIGRLVEGGGPVAEVIPGGPLLSLPGRPRGRSPRLDLVDPGGKPRVQLALRKPFFRRTATVLLEGTPLAELRGGRRGQILEEVRAEAIDFTVHGDPMAPEMEARRDGRVIATLSPDIAPAPGCAGLEVLNSIDPRPVLAVFLGICLLRAHAGPLEAPAAAPAAAGEAAS